MNASMCDCGAYEQANLYRVWTGHKPDCSVFGKQACAPQTVENCYGFKLMTLDEQLATLQAAKEGKTVEVLTRAGWEPTTPTELFDFASRTYRVKREPKTIYVNDYGTHLVAYETQEDAERAANPEFKVRVAVPYREVTE